MSEDARMRKCFKCHNREPERASCPTCGGKGRIPFERREQDRMVRRVDCHSVGTESEYLP